MFNPVAARAVMKVNEVSGQLDRVLEFGNQRLDKSLHKPGVETTKDWYISQGFTEYLAIDVNEKMDAVIGDLNYEIHLGRRFDLVTDNGTGEHLFNQAAVFENQHRMTEVGGVMLKIMPFTPWPNHGFYNYNPILFRDVVAANSYRWLFMWIVDRTHTPKDIPTDPDSWAFMEKRQAKLIDYIAPKNWTTDLYLVGAWQKTSAAPFEFPLQGKYKKDVTDDALHSRYVEQ
jgi:hypothetical protein